MNGLKPHIYFREGAWHYKPSLHKGWDVDWDNLNTRAMLFCIMRNNK